MARAFRRAARLDARRHGLPPLHFRRSSHSKRVRPQVVDDGTSHIDRVARRRGGRRWIRRDRRSHRTRARDDVVDPSLLARDGGTRDIASAVATLHVAIARRIRHGRRVVVRIGARRRNVAGAASRKSDGIHAVGLGNRRGREARQKLVQQNDLGYRRPHEPASPTEPVFHLRRPGGGAGHVWRAFTTRGEAIAFMRQAYGAPSEGADWAEGLPVEDFETLLRTRASRP